jgi:hypothetical protein
LAPCCPSSLPSFPLRVRSPSSVFLSIHPSFPSLLMSLPFAYPHSSLPSSPSFSFPARLYLLWLLPCPNSFPFTLPKPSPVLVYIVRLSLLDSCLVHLPLFPSSQPLLTLASLF